VADGRPVPTARAGERFRRFVAGLMREPAGEAAAAEGREASELLKALELTQVTPAHELERRALASR
jgi:hypothetical protein